MRRPTRALGLASVLAIGGLVAGEARADYPAIAPYVGAYGGAVIPLKDWDLGVEKPAAAPNLPKASGMLGARVGLQIVRPLAIEGEFAWIPLRVDRGDTNTAVAYNANVLVHLLSSDWTPYLLAGVGAYQNLTRVRDGGLGRDWDQRAHAGLGLRGLTNGWLAVRAEVRDVITDGTNDGIGNNFEASIGLDGFLTAAPKPVPDRDKDGIDDAADACPDVAGPAATRGCPDADGDGIIDSQDKCPDQRGVEALGGCPDTDADGTADADDVCPKQAGLAEFKGCPDADKDGIADADDRCPMEAGSVALKGCPDRDGDGLTDAEDACPDRSGPVDLKGCPDSDNDGVIDAEDKCPEVPGLKDNQGCLPDAVKKFTGAIKGINFATGKAKLLADSFKVLDSAVKVMKQYPGLRISIEGHTDNVGKSDDNQKLSLDRAEAVKAYFVGQGVAPDRLKTQGLGDAKPLQDNTTAKGKAANRRIEFVPLGHD
jgi:outer membrane protein OmpA-like peptidoglycan-associated protein